MQFIIVEENKFDFLVYRLMTDIRNMNGLYEIALNSTHFEHL